MGADTPNHFNGSKNLDRKPRRASNHDQSLFARNWRVLHIEDDDGDAYLVRHALQKAGIPAEVHRCLNSEEGLLFLRSADTWWPDVVLLDLNTPRMNGWEFLTTIKADKALRGLHVVIVTSSRLPEDRERALELGAKDFQTKPDRFDELIHMLEGILAVPLEKPKGSRCADPGLTPVLA